ncbi:MAG: heme-binding domain-containing protein [Terriglobales bacterium]
MSTRRYVILGCCLVALGLIQAIPYGHDHSDPPTVAEPHWHSAQTRALFQRACFDCHSSNTVWPWYSNVAPMSWLVERDVQDGRRRMNLSEWNRPQKDAANVANRVRSGDMPLWYYLPMHPRARLSAAEKQELIAGAARSLGPQKPPRRH